MAKTQESHSSQKYNQKKKILEITLCGNVDAQITQRVLDDIALAVSQKPLRGIYLDLSPIKSFNSQAIERATRISHGTTLLPMAVVGAADILRIIINYLGFISGYDVRFFKRRLDAIKWLGKFDIHTP